MRILLADEDERFLEIAQAYFWDCDHEAEIANNGMECLVFLQEFRPDVLVIDQDAMGSGNDHVVARMRGSDDLMHIPVVLLSDKNREPSRSQGLELPLISFITRPFRLPELVAWVEFVGNTSAQGKTPVDKN